MNNRNRNILILALASATIVSAAWAGGGGGSRQKQIPRAGQTNLPKANSSVKNAPTSQSTAMPTQIMRTTTQPENSRVTRASTARSGRMGFNFAKYPYSIAPRVNEKTGRAGAPICKIFAIPDVVSVNKRFLRRRMLNNRSGAACNPDVKDEAALKKLKNYHLENMLSNQPDEQACLRLATQIVNTCRTSVSTIYQTSPADKRRTILAYEGKIVNNKSKTSPSKQVFVGTGTIDVKKISNPQPPSRLRSLKQSKEFYLAAMKRSPAPIATPVATPAPVAAPATAVKNPIVTTVKTPPPAPTPAAIQAPSITPVTISNPTPKSVVIATPAAPNNNKMTPPGRNYQVPLVGIKNPKDEIKPVQVPSVQVTPVAPPPKVIPGNREITPRTPKER